MKSSTLFKDVKGRGNTIGFSFNFFGNEDVDEPHQPTKKNKKKKKKKKKAIESTALTPETGDVVDENMTDCIRDFPLHDGCNQATQPSCTCKEECLDISEEACDIVIERMASLGVAEEAPNASNSNQQKKKKKKAKKKKSPTDVAQVVSGATGSQDSGKMITENDTNSANICRKQMSKEEGAPTFYSPRDPKLDVQTQKQRRYGQGTNLVALSAIGPRSRPKVRGKPISTWSVPPGLGISEPMLQPARDNLSGEQEVSSGLSLDGHSGTAAGHSSPFSFSFNGL